MSACCKPTTWLLVLALLCGNVAVSGAAPAQRTRESLQNAFLLRTVDDLAHTLGYAEEMLALLQEPEVRPMRPVTDTTSREKRLLLEFQQKEVGWLKLLAGEYDRDVESFFAQLRATPAWVSRHKDMVEKFRERAADLEGQLAQLERRRSEQEARCEKLERAVRERRLLLSLDDLELARQLWPNYDHHDFDPREPIYKKLSDSEVLQLHNESDRLRETIDALDTLADLEGYERRWCVMKGEEFAKGHAVAKAFVSAAEGDLALALEDLITTYALQSKMLGNEIVRIEQTMAVEDASIKYISHGLERDPQDYYRQFKDRFERHRAWLNIQAESYRLDLDELRRD